MLHGGLAAVTLADMREKICPWYGTQGQVLALYSLELVGMQRIVFMLRELKTSGHYV